MNNQFFESTTQEQPVQEQEHAAVEQEAAAIPQHVLDNAPLVNAISTYQTWLSNQPRQIGPFGIFWNAEEGQALVKQYREEQGWS